MPQVLSYRCIVPRVNLPTMRRRASVGHSANQAIDTNSWCDKIRVQLKDAQKVPHARAPRLLPCCTLHLVSLQDFPAHLAAQQPQQVQKITSTDLARAHMMLRQAYDDVKKNYYDPKYHGVDLDIAVYHQYDTRLDASQTINESFRIIAAFLANLHDSHTFFMPPARVNRSTTGFHMEMVGDKCFVTRIRPGTDAAAKLHVGDQVLELNGFNITRDEFSNMRYFFQVLSPSYAEKLDLATPAGERRQEVVLSKVRSGKEVLDISGEGAGSDLWDLVRGDEEDSHLNRERIFEDEECCSVWKMPNFFSSSAPHHHHLR